MRKSILLVFMTALGIFIIPGLSHAEFYFTGYAGTANSGDADVSDNTGGGGGAGIIEFDSSLSAGAKLGHWFNKQGASFLGVEVDLNVHFPVFTSITGVTGAWGPAQDLVGDTTVYSGTINALIRYPDGNIRPYVGLGGGVFHAKVDDGVATIRGAFTGDEDTGFGWHVMAGLYTAITSHVSIFAEYRYVFADFEFDDPSKIGLDVNYRASQLNGGFSFNF